MADALIGKKDYLFLSADSNGILDQHCGRVTIADRIPALRQVHQARATLAGRYLHIVVPNKETVARDLMPEAFPYEADGPTPLHQYLRPHDRTLYFAPDILAAFQQEGFYYRYDSHWTTLGALTYLKAACAHFGLTDVVAALQDLKLATSVDPAPGDLGSRIGRTSEGARRMDVVAPRMRPVFTNQVTNEGCIRHFSRDDAPVRQRVLILHDSMAQWLVQILAEIFSETLMIHTPDLDMDCARRMRPDLLMFLQVERFFPRVPRNDIDYAALIAQQQTEKGSQADGVAWLRGLGYLPSQSWPT